MAKGKKKKDADFQKVKLKVGRRLKRDNNETKAEFKTRKIVLKEVKSHSADPITALAHHSEHISQHGKLSLLNHFNSALTADIVKSLTKPIMDSLAKFTIDHSEQVRAATYRCLKTCINHMKHKQVPLGEFAYLIKPYLDCAFTHIDGGTSRDCLKFLGYLTNTNEPELFEPLMHVILRKFDTGGVGAGELGVAQRLKLLYLKHRKRVDLEVERRNELVEPLVWSASNFLLDLELDVHGLGRRAGAGCEPSCDRDREVMLVPQARLENVVEEFLSKIPELGSEEQEGVERPARATKRFRSV